jgi:hypothetical protein
VAVGIDPFVTRTALHKALSLDSRIEALLIPEGHDLVAAAIEVGASVLITSLPVEGPEIATALLSEDSPVVDVIQHGQSIQTVPYAGLTSLADFLAKLGASVT